MAKSRRQKATRAARAAKPKQSPQDKLREKAQWVADKTRLPRGARIVVAITDERGDWLGVGSNTNPIDTAAILLSAFRGSPTHRRGTEVIEAAGVEVVERPALLGRAQ